MISFAAGTRYLSLLGGVCLSFYDWYCDLPPSSPQTWGEQTDVPESADWYNAGFLILWGSNVPQTRTPDAHFYTEARYRGAKSAVISPDYSEASKFGDIWLSVKQGTDSALAMAMGHVILKQFHVDRQVDYFVDYIKRYTDMPMLVKLVQQEGKLVPDRFLRASDLDGALGRDQQSGMEDPGFRCDERRTGRAARLGRLPLGREGQVESRSEKLRRLAGRSAAVPQGPRRMTWSMSPSPISAISRTTISPFRPRQRPEPPAFRRRSCRPRTAKSWSPRSMTCSSPIMASIAALAAKMSPRILTRTFLTRRPGPKKSPASSREKIVQVAHEFALNAEKTKGRSMVIIGAGMNHWYNCDMNYRGVINMLVMCGCVGQSGGGWAHYVGQEKLRPQAGWAPVAFALDWGRPPRHQNGTSYFYAHTDQWRYETSRTQGNSVADRARRSVGRGADRLQRPRRAHGLAALRAATRTEPADHRGTGRRKGPRAEGLRRPGAGFGRVENVLRGSRRSEELAAQSVRLALQPARLVGQGARIFPQAPARNVAWRSGQESRRSGAGETAGGRLARRRAGRKARPAGDARFPHVHHLRLFRYRAARGHLVREGRPQHLRHASLHPSARRGGRSDLGGRAPTGKSTRESPRPFRRSRRKCWASRRTSC